MDSLRKRHLQLNSKVNDAYKKKAKLEDIGPDKELSDVDRIIKINLASKYKDINYIVATLKSGDSLYVNKALKTVWMFDKQYSMIINPDYINREIKPNMSEKMFIKFLNVTSQNLRDNRTIDFYEYCMRMKMPEHAKKFLIFTPESYKLKAIDDPASVVDDELIFAEDVTFLQKFIGNSFVLAEKFIKNVNSSNERYIPKIVHLLRHLHAVDTLQYLKLLETHCASKMNIKFGLRISKHIVTKHMDRILKHPKLYVQVLEQKTLLKHCNQDKAELLAEAIFPEKVNDFWSNSNYKALEPFLSKTHHEEKFLFIKGIFAKKYPQEQFETNKCFSSQMHEFMTAEQKQAWAIKQVASEEEFFGSGNNYKWYNYIDFDRSFYELQKLIRITPSKDKRLDIILVMINKARNNDELELVLDYFIKRHMNESADSKIRFIDVLLNKFNAFCLNDVSWEKFDALLHSLDVYKLERNSYRLATYRIIAAVRHTVSRFDVGDMPESMQSFLQNTSAYNSLHSCLKKYNPAELENVYEFVLELRIEKLKSFENIPYTSEVKKDVKNILDDILNLAKKFNKGRESLPPLVQHFVKLDSSFDPQPQPQPKLTVGSLLRDLKNDVETFTAQFPLLKELTQSYYYSQQNLRSLSVVLNKLRVYFYDDVAKQWLANFVALLQDSKTSAEKKTAANAIMLLADQDYKIKLLKELAPENEKIDHVKIDTNLLEKQEAVCNFIGRSRPSVPNDVLMMYLKGDYLKYCLPIFSMYGRNLTPADRAKFIESILDKPLSIQKHGIRLAFKYCDMNTITAMVMRIWKSTKNVSLRSNLYTELYTKLTNIDDEKERAETFELLLKMTAEVHADDSEEVFDCLTQAYVPDQLRPAYVTQSWKVICKLPKTIQMLKHQSSMAHRLANCIGGIDRDFIKGIIDAFISDMLVKKKIISTIKDEQNSYYDAMWSLVVEYITDDHDNDSKTKLVQDIAKHYLLLRNECRPGTNVKPMADRFERIVNDLAERYWNKTGTFAKMNQFYNIIIQMISHIPLWERYAITANIKVHIIAKFVREEAVTNNLEWKAIAAAIGKQMVGLIREMVIKNEFYETLMENFMEIIYGATSILSAKFGKKYHDENFDLEVAIALLETDMRETYLVALNLIKEHKNLMGDKGSPVFDKIKASKYNDVKALMHHVKEKS